MNIIDKHLALKAGFFRIDICVLGMAVLLSISPVITMTPGIIRIFLVLVRIGIYALCFVDFVISGKVKQFLLGIALIAVWILATIRLYPMNKPALLEIAPDMFMQIFYFSLGNSCINSKSIIKTCTVFAYIEFAFLTLFVVSTTGRLYIISSRDSYATISNGFFWIALFFTFAPKEENRFSKISAVAALIMMLIYGRRSHILYYAVAVCIYSFRKMVKEKNVTAGKIALRIFLLCAAVTVGLFYKQILLLLSGFLTSVGVNSRTIMMILSGEFGDLNGRDALYELAWHMTLERPLLGNGIGSTMVRWMALHPDTPNYAGCNSHNSILEVGAEFGFPGMVIFVILAVRMIVKSMSFDLTREEETILFTLMGTGLITVLIGASYLTSFQFALFCGYYFYLKNREKIIQKQSAL